MKNSAHHILYALCIAPVITTPCFGSLRAALAAAKSSTTARALPASANKRMVTAVEMARVAGTEQEQLAQLHGAQQALLEGASPLLYIAHVIKHLDSSPILEQWINVFLDSASIDARLGLENKPTPLMAAIQYGKDNCARLFLRKGANPQEIDSEGLNARDIADKYSKTAAQYLPHLGNGTPRTPRTPTSAPRSSLSMPIPTAPTN